MAALDPTDLVDLYWAGRTTLVVRHDQIPVYDRAFRRFFLDESDALPEPFRSAMKPVGQANAVLEIPATEPGVGADDDRPAQLGLMASDVDLWRNKSFAACTPEELASIRRIMARIRLMPPRRRTRRTVGSPSGRRPDPRKTVRETMRTHGEPAELFWRRRRTRLAAADPDPRRVGLDVGLLAQPVAVRVLHTPGSITRRGVLLRHAPDPDHEGTGATPAGRRARRRRQGRLRLGGRHPHRRFARRVRAGMGPAGDQSRCDRRDLLRRPRPRRPGRARECDGAAARDSAIASCG